VILVDTSVLLDVLNNDPVWARRSQQVLEIATATDQLAINDIVYAELSSRFPTIEAFDQALSSLPLEHVPIPNGALFLAGKAFRRYRESGGTKSNVLPDFFIGAHAAYHGISLVTRDPRRMRSYFPSLSLIEP
jgi:predicted nucleic acid-binding protein